MKYEFPRREDLIVSVSHVLRGASDAEGRGVGKGKAIALDIDQFEKRVVVDSLP